MTKINGSDLNGIRSLDTDKRSKQASAPSADPSGSRPSSADNVSLSDVKKTVKVLMELAASVPEINAKRVELLKATLNAGNYQIDSKNIARKMILAN